MKLVLPRVALLLLFLAPILRGEETGLNTAVRAANDERVAAMIAANQHRLDEICSDQLHYAHSNGKLDTKATFIESLVTHHTAYESVG